MGRLLGHVLCPACSAIKGMWARTQDHRTACYATGKEWDVGGPKEVRVSASCRCPVSGDRRNWFTGPVSAASGLGPRLPCFSPVQDTAGSMFFGQAQAEETDDEEGTMVVGLD